LAEKQLKSFTRRMATDKFIMCMLCLVVLGFVGMIIVSVFDIKIGGGGNDGNSTATDEEPEARTSISNF
jgi:phosphotransferase system  glucose/maltose/N-acetylglucosamine-specific IIC component